MTSRRKYIFIASPFFNEAQLEVVKALETMIQDAGMFYYSARLHSGGSTLPPGERRFSKWTPVFQADVSGLYNCDLVVAVLDYPLPKGHRLEIRKATEHASDVLVATPRIPDSGTVWEMGFAYALGKPIVGYFPLGKPEKLNLMLIQCCSAITWDRSSLERFLQAYGQGETDWSLLVPLPSLEVEVE